MYIVKEIRSIQYTTTTSGKMDILLIQRLSNSHNEPVCRSLTGLVPSLGLVTLRSTVRTLGIRFDRGQYGTKETLCRPLSDLIISVYSPKIGSTPITVQDKEIDNLTLIIRDGTCSV